MERIPARYVSFTGDTQQPIWRAVADREPRKGKLGYSDKRPSRAGPSQFIGDNLKRSEMVEKIHNWYWNNHPNFRAKDLLGILESEGMVPPGRVIEVPDINDTNQKYMSYTWEPEDE